MSTLSIAFEAGKLSCLSLFADELITAAIKRSIEHCFTHDTLKPKMEKKKLDGDQLAVHEDPTGEAGDGNRELENLKTSLLSKYGSSRAVWATFSREGMECLGKKETQRIVKEAIPTLSKEKAKLLRRALPRRMGLEKLSRFLGEGGSHQQDTRSAKTHFARLPAEVPQLPPSFRGRPHAHELLVAALLDSSTQSTSLTAPQSRVSSQGMGGVGKTMLCAAVVRDKRVRSAFELICWVSTFMLHTCATVKSDERRSTCLNSQIYAYCKGAYSSKYQAANMCQAMRCLWKAKSMHSQKSVLRGRFSSFLMTWLVIGCIASSIVVLS